LADPLAVYVRHHVHNDTCLAKGIRNHVPAEAAIDEELRR